VYKKRIQNLKKARQEKKEKGERRKENRLKSLSSYVKSIFCVLDKYIVDIYS
jgi:hypothetical protein